MTEKEFKECAKDYSDTAWHNAMLFELISAAYSAVARCDWNGWRDTMIKLESLPKDNLTLARIRDTMATICDDGTHMSESMITSDLFDVLDVED